ncbi:MAG: hypothetical protein GX764_03855 [Firmicutes bacterium]|nr:hypothetical protein [Bacillota bacterium]
MFEKSRQLLEEEGYLHYEISNYACPGFQGQHNCRYWQAKPYLGIGAGASGYLYGERYTNTCSVRDYINILSAGKLPLAQREHVGYREAMAEKMFLGLRLLEGVSMTDFEKQFGVKLKDVFGRSLVDDSPGGTLCRGSRVYYCGDKKY